MTKMVSHIQGGVLALMTEDDYAIWATGLTAPTFEEAAAKGVRWYVFITMERANRYPDMMPKATATTKDWEHIKHRFSVREANFHVPLSNGPKHWEAEARVGAINTWSQLLHLSITSNSSSK